MAISEMPGREKVICSNNQKLLMLIIYSSHLNPIKGIDGLILAMTIQIL